MSRDWTPREAYFADKYMVERENRHFYEMVFTIGIGDKQTKFPNEETSIIYNKFPYLAITMVDRLIFLNENINENILSELNRYVALICNKDTGEQAIFFDKSLKNKTIVDWYNGQLDRGFYYREYNDDLLVDYILDIKEPNDIWNN